MKTLVSQMSYALPVSSKRVDSIVTSDRMILAAKRSLRTAGALPFDRVNALDRGLTVAFASPSSIADTSHPSA